MPTGWFSTRLAFTRYLFVPNNSDPIEVWGNENVILGWVEYDVLLKPSSFISRFSVVRSRARPWCEEVHNLLCDSNGTFVSDPNSITPKSQKLKAWLRYDEKQKMKRLVLDRPLSKRATKLFREKKWSKLVRRYHVSPETLSMYLDIEHDLVAEAFIIDQFIQQMKRYCTDWLTTEECSIPILYQDKSICIDRLLENGSILTDVDDTTNEARWALNWAVRCKYTKIRELTYTSWHRFIDKRQIPMFRFELPKRIEWNNTTRVHTKIDRRYDEEGDAVGKTAMAFIAPTETAVWVNAYTRQTVVRVKKDFVRKGLKWMRGDTYTLYPSDCLPNTYLCQGQEFPFDKAYKYFENCHPARFEDLCTMKPGAAHLVVCVNQQTPGWVLMDAHIAAGNKKFICIEIS